VPYRGVAPAVTDLLGGRAHVLFDPIPSSIGYVHSGELRALAVTTAQRSESSPNTPTLGEVVPGYEASTWFGVGAPRDTPGDIVGKLNDTINAVLRDPAIKARLTDLGTNIFVGSPADFARFIVAEVDKWANVVTRAGIKPV
jgi:tripartite-type tricarboxylate transporter receptor subunit TctC